METEFKVGDKVHDYKYGHGKVIEINKNLAHPIVVEFYMATHYYTLDGRDDVWVNITLFHEEHVLVPISVYKTLINGKHK